jgi:hypothetical protein
MSTFNDSNLPRIPDNIDMQRLKAMQFVARMKETAERVGVGFIGGFIGPDGQKFMMTNMNQDEVIKYLPDELK